MPKLRIKYKTNSEQLAADHVKHELKVGRIRAIPPDPEGQIIRPPVEVLMEREFRYLFITDNILGDPPRPYAAAYYRRAFRQQRAFKLGM